MIQFASARIEEEWDNLHPELRQIMDDFGHWSAANRLPIPVITCIKRTQEENHNIYGVQRFSWHLADIKTGRVNAVDVRTKHYTTDQRAKVFAWFHEKCPDVKRFELITKVHGTGPHVHLAIREHR